MSNSRSTPGDFREDTSANQRDLLGRIRRFVIGAIGAVKWQLVGHTLPSGEPETRDAEPFTGIGFYSRPPSGANAEVVAVFPGGASNPVIVGFRDEATRQAMVGDLEDDETAIYTSKAVVRIKPDGSIEIVAAAGGEVKIMAAGGAPLKIPTTADFEALRTYVAHQFDNVNGHIHTVAGAITTTQVTGPGPYGVGPVDIVLTPDPPDVVVGTVVLKAE